MARNKKTIRAFKICPENEKDQFGLDVFNVLKVEKRRPSMT